MSLERMQGLHHSHVSNQHNVSGSNDPQQIPHDMTEQLIKGAQAFAEGRRVGMTDDDVLRELYRQTLR